jgi:hypothetical protein
MSDLINETLFWLALIEESGIYTHNSIEIVKQELQKF